MTSLPHMHWSAVILAQVLPKKKKNVSLSGTCTAQCTFYRLQAFYCLYCLLYRIQCKPSVLFNFGSVLDCNENPIVVFMSHYYSQAQTSYHFPFKPGLHVPQVLRHWLTCMNSEQSGIPIGTQCILYAGQLIGRKAKWVEASWPPFLKFVSVLL